MSSSPAVLKRRVDTIFNACTRHILYGTILCANRAPPNSRNNSLFKYYHEQLILFKKRAEKVLAFGPLWDNKEETSSIIRKPNSFCCGSIWISSRGSTCFSLSNAANLCKHETAISRRPNSRNASLYIWFVRTNFNKKYAQLMLHFVQLKNKTILKFKY